ncbi:MAG: S8 family serine peptidase, partial [Chloroflexia bacterium]|nr:S8 family serine peptidase [Chloroflexia bacterium]
MKRLSALLALLVMVLGAVLPQAIMAQGPVPQKALPAPREQAPAGPAEPISVQQGAWEFGPATPFEWTRFDAVFVPGPEGEAWANKIYFMGGRTGGDTHATDIWSFDPLTEVYADTGHDMLVNSANYTAHLIEDDGTGRGPAIYTVGGYDAVAGVNHGDVQRYYPQTGEVELLPDADDWTVQVAGQTVGAMGQAVVNDVIYVFGGWESTAAPYFYAGTWAFDPNQPSGSRWTDLSLNLTPARAYIQVAAQGGKVYAIGGISEYTGSDLVPTDVVEVLDTADLGAGWQPLAPMPVAGGEGRAFGFDADTVAAMGLDEVLSGKIYVAGAADWSAGSLEAMEYDIAMDYWDQAFPDLNEDRRDHAGAFVPLCTPDPSDGLPGMWVFGGRWDSGDAPPFAPTEYYPLECISCNVLLVDDDWDQYSGEPFNGTGDVYYTETLNFLGYDWDYWDVWTQGDPTAADLMPYDAVIWFTGYAWAGTVTPTNEADLATYLDAGGNLFLTAYDYLYDQGLSSFGATYLGIDSFFEDTGETDPVGNAGNPVGDGLGPYTLTAPTSWPSGSVSIDFADDVFAGAGAGSPFRYQASGLDNSTSYDSGTYKTVYFGWPFEGLDDLNERAEVLDSILTWFCYSGPPAGFNLIPPAQTGAAVIGSEIVYTVTVANDMGAVDSFTLTYDSMWMAEGPAAVGPVPDGGMASFNVTVTVPTDANCFDMDEAMVLATSQFNPIFTDTAYLQTTAGAAGDALDVEGYVYDANTGLPLSEAYIEFYVGNEVDEYYFSAWVDANGYYNFGESIPACTYDAMYNSYGYHNLYPYPVTVIPGMTNTVDVSLTAAWPELADDAVQVDVYVGQMYTYTTTLANYGTGDLNFHISEVASDSPFMPDGMPRGVDPQVYAELRLNGGSGKFMVYMAEQADLDAAFEIADWSARGHYVLETLQATAARSQAGLLAELEALGVPYESRYIVNAIQVEGSIDLVNQIAARAEVAYIGPNAEVDAPEPVDMGPTIEGQVDTVWNIDQISTTLAWNDFGGYGEGVVVSNIDTGVLYTHTALVQQYRGTISVTGGIFDHNYNWWDPYGDKPDAPYDWHSHGSHTIGTMSGSDDPAHPFTATQGIGIAPRAQWIACNGFDHGGSGYTAELLECAEFILAPWDLAGTNPMPDYRPHVVNNSWGGGAADWWYNQAIYAW